MRIGCIFRLIHDLLESWPVKEIVKWFILQTIRRQQLVNNIGEGGIRTPGAAYRHTTV